MASLSWVVWVGRRLLFWVGGSIGTCFGRFGRSQHPINWWFALVPPTSIVWHFLGGVPFVSDLFACFLFFSSSFGSSSVWECRGNKRDAPFGFCLLVNATRLSPAAKSRLRLDEVQRSLRSEVGSAPAATLKGRHAGGRPTPMPGPGPGALAMAELEGLQP